MDRLVLSEVRRLYVEQRLPLPISVETALRADSRKGAHAILDAIDRRRFRNRSEGQRLRTMLRFERELWAAGFERIAGIDEAGMSPLAGPVAAGAVILPVACRIPGVDDSKKLDPKERDRLAPIIRANAVAWGVAFVEPDEIDRINIYWAGLLAMKRALLAMELAADYLLIDGRKLNDMAIAQRRLYRGDELSLSIAAASILAKTARDARMVELDAQYPGYGLARHKGYPVAEHFRALQKLGPCPIHRRSFEPVRQAQEQHVSEDLVPR